MESSHQLPHSGSHSKPSPAFEAQTSAKPSPLDDSWSTARWLDLVPAVFFKQAQDGSILWMHGAIEPLTGASSEIWESGEINFWKQIHELDQDKFREHFEASRQTDEVLSVLYRIRHAVTGAAMWVEERRRWETPRTGIPFYQVAWVDVTVRERAMARLAGNAWSRTLASLTPGLAHDLNNHFASILALSDTYVRQSGPGHPFHEGLKTIRSSVQDAAKLVQRLVGLQASQRAEKRYHNLNEIVREVIEVLRHTTTRKVQFDVELAPGNLPIYVDAVALRRAIIGMARNSVESMGGEGRIQFRTDPASALASEVRPHLPGNRMPLVCFSISDTGPGVPERFSPHVFEPLQSTKPMNEGCGFSLHLARTFAESAGGTITLDTTTTVGATFRIWLPQSDLTEMDQAFASDETRTRVILVVGPEGTTEEAVQLLRKEGYRVLTTESHAQELVECAQPPLDAVLCLKSVPAALVDQWVQFVRLRRSPTKIIRECDALDPLASPLSRPSGDLILSRSVLDAEVPRRIRQLLFPGFRSSQPPH